MPVSDPIVESLMAPGAPFEVVTEGAIRVFKNTPRSMSDVFDRARQFGDAEFIVAGDVRLTYQEFFSRADALSDDLVRRANIKPGQSVAICMKNSPEWMIAFVAILNAGAVAVLVNSRGSEAAMAKAVSDTDSVMVIADQRRADKLVAGGVSLPILQGGDFPQAGAGFDPIRRNPTDVAAMFFTSGTTGVAKAAAVNHRALITGMMNTQMAMAAVFQKMAKAYGIDVQTLRSQMPQSCSLLVFPLFHTSGCSALFLTAITTGGKLVLMERWNASDALDLIEQENITSFGGVPAMFWDVLQDTSFKDRDLKNLMSISCGGQALPMNLLSEIRAAFPRAYIGAGYGMTETCGAISQANGESFLANPSASGQILPMMDVQISDETGTALPVGSVGEIWAKGATLMDGYYGRPKETKASMSGDWLKTGDIGRIDENGYIYIVDRKTDMVISAGENIYCAHVEQVMSKNENVLAIASFGVPDKRLGERLVVSVQVKVGTSEGEILDFAKANLADYEVPSDIILRTEAFDLSAMGKIEKHKLRKLYLEKEAIL